MHIRKHIKTSITALALGIMLSACGGEEASVDCNTLCPAGPQSDAPTIYTLQHSGFEIDADQQKVPVTFVNSNLYAVGQNNKLVRPDSKSDGLNPLCFAKNSFVPSTNIEDLQLTKANTTIMFLNFDQNGRLESRVLNKKKNGSGLDAYITIENQLTGAGNYQIVIDALAGIQRPQPGNLDANGFEARDVTGLGVPSTKTPFYKSFQYDSKNKTGVKDHVFFYVLLDSDLSFFSGNTLAMLPYVASIPNSGVLYSPYIQEPIKVNTATGTEVMAVRFYRGGGMATEIHQKESCSYPYDIGVIANGQNGHAPDTPMLIDPETDATGPIQ